MNNIIPGGRFRCIMKEFDNTSLDEPPGIEDRIEMIEILISQIGKQMKIIRAELADLHTQTAREIQQQDLDDPEWY